MCTFAPSYKRQLADCKRYIRVATVSSLLGHAQVSTTLDIYTHAFDKNKAASDKLHNALEDKGAATAHLSRGGVAVSAILKTDVRSIFRIL